MLRANELREQTEQELAALYQTLSKEIFTLRTQAQTMRSVEKPHLLRMKKKERARVLTVLREKTTSVLPLILDGAKR